ncbi:hypothetical protein HYV50_04475 [Candidatus Pacearchaeota archaeon]|nr:hypothetical protein [Candidatus Pacearchaeota archaeon]
MTTIIGLKTNYEANSIIIVSDRQKCRYEGDKLIAKEPVKKIYSGKSWSMADDGGDDDEVIDFYHTLQGRSAKQDKQFDQVDLQERTKSMIEKVIKESFFAEVRDLNTKLMKNGADLDQTHSFIFATTHPELGLWLIDPFGNLHKPHEQNHFQYIAIGSGKEEAEKYIDSLINGEKVDREKITTRRGIKIAKETIAEAEKDAFTGLGYDLVILNQQKWVKEWGKKIRNDMKKAEEMSLESIANEYEPPEIEEKEELLQKEQEPRAA